MSDFLRDHRVLDNGELRPPKDLAEWCEFMESDKKVVAAEVVDGYLVSTVCLGIEHFGGYWYETMVFQPTEDGTNFKWFPAQLCERYKTLEEARKGHAIAAARVSHAVEQIGKWDAPN